MTTYRVGDVLSGGYRVIDVKRGGMGVVYICHQPPDRFYAVKTVDPATAATQDPEAIAQFFKYFRDEVDLWIRVSRQARHENIVEALLYNEHEHWLFLEYVDGLSVAEAARRKPLHLRHVVDWSIGVARGMDLMHSKFKLIHRDLKPQNVLIDKDGLVPKISDLGIAKVLQDDQGENTIIGTAGYRAPETWAGRTDFLSDVYSFGATLYAMLTGGPPKGRDNPLDIGRSIPSPSESNPRVPSELDAIVMRCLAPTPGDRYQSFAEIIPLLEALGPFEGPKYDEGYHYCAAHDFWSWIGDGTGVCFFCQQSASGAKKLEEAMTVVATAPYPPGGAEATVPEQTMALPPGIAPHTMTRTALEPTMSAPIPQTLVAPELHTAPAPTPVTSPVKKIAAIVAAVVIAIVVWAAWPSGVDPEHLDVAIKDSRHSVAKDSGDGVDGGKETSDPKVQLTSSAKVECADPDCRQMFVQDFVEGDIRQKYCPLNPKHVKCAQCGFRAISAAIFAATDCVNCGHTSWEPLEIEKD
ncbi:MAG: serine/threonine protein kinase [Planctomycetes bacterium]|nr:serine/threonine protein kinase [Planctomycetota bacterium]